MTARLPKILTKRKLLISAALVAFVSVLSILVVGWSRKQAQATTHPLDVEVVQVQQKDVSVYSEWIGTTDGMVNAEIKPQVTGYLLRQAYKEGSFVKKGQVLFEIDPRP